MSKPTPGPWTPSLSFRAALVLGPGHEGAQPRLICDCSPDNADASDEDRANAALIAAAPEMRALLDNVLAWFEEWNVEIGAAEETLLEPISALLERVELWT
jgi:hypothetical protein